MYKSLRPSKSFNERNVVINEEPEQIEQMEQDEQAEQVEQPKETIDNNIINFHNGLSNVLNFHNVNRQIEAIYMSSGTYYSITFDLISLYLKGQKLLYTESKSFCELVLYCLMLPAIFISSACTVLNVPLKSVSYGSTIVSALNGFNSFLLAFVSYVKLDAKAEAHKTTAYQFDKLQTMCEFYSGKVQLAPPEENPNKKIYEYIESIEKKVGEIKDANQFSIPEVIRYRYNHIYSYNIFAMMKNHKTKRSLNIQKLIDITIEIEKRTKDFVYCNKCNVSRGVLCSGCKETRIIMETGIQSFPLKSIFKKGNINEVEIDIYDKTVSMETLLRQRDLIIKAIIEYRDMTINLTGQYNSEYEEWTNKKKNEWCPIFNWLKM